MDNHLQAAIRAWQADPTNRTLREELAARYRRLGLCPSCGSPHWSDPKSYRCKPESGSGQLTCHWEDLPCICGEVGCGSTTLPWGNHSYALAARGRPAS